MAKMILHIFCFDFEWIRQQTESGMRVEEKADFVFSTQCQGVLVTHIISFSTLILTMFGKWSLLSVVPGDGHFEEIGRQVRQDNLSEERRKKR